MSDITNQQNFNDSRSYSASASKHKMVFLGDQSVGKTSVINRFIFDVFDEKDHPTVGIDFISKTMNIQDRQLRLQLWDTAGQERFRTLIPSYIRDSACAVIVFDVTNEKSFQNVDRWHEDVKSQRGQEALIVLVANKIDLKDKRVISSEQTQKKAQDLDMMLAEVSAKNGQGVSELFQQISQNLYQKDANTFLMSSAGYYNINIINKNLGRQTIKKLLFLKSSF